MRLRHILAATDESDAGRQAVRTAFDLASRTSAKVTVLRVLVTEASGHLVSPGRGASENGHDDTAHGHLRRWLEAGVLSPGEVCSAKLAVAVGIPGVEICRVAEDAGVDLVVLGRKRHSQMMRLLLGDTADAVARRSRVPCLFVPPGAAEVRHVLAALDGTARGISVLTEACDFAGATGSTLRAITVEHTPGGEPLDIVVDLPVARSSSLHNKVQEVLARKNLDLAPLAIRRGEVSERVLAEVQETGADVLAIGYHRGGPPGVIDAGSTARRLAHLAPCAVLTIPL
jgi:nucleotide-binding universal stress UspA family protein